MKMHARPWAQRALFALLVAAGTAGCGGSLIHAGAEMTASGLSSGTSAMASNRPVSVGSGAEVVAGVALMVAGYHALPDHQRAPFIPPQPLPGSPAPRYSPISSPYYSGWPIGWY